MTIHSDWDAVPDLHEFVVAIDEEFAKLHHRADDSPVRLASREAG